MAVVLYKYTYLLNLNLNVVSRIISRLRQKLNKILGFTSASTCHMSVSESATSTNQRPWKNQLKIPNGQ